MKSIPGSPASPAESPSRVAPDAICTDAASMPILKSASLSTTTARLNVSTWPCSGIFARNADAAAHRRVLLLDEPLRQPHVRRVIIRAVAAKNFLRVLLRVIHVLARRTNRAVFHSAPTASFADAACRTFKPTSACCSLILCNCTRASSLNAASCVGKTIRGLERAPRLDCGSPFTSALLPAVRNSSASLVRSCVEIDFLLQIRFQIDGRQFAAATAWSCNCNEPSQCFTCHLSFSETRHVMFSSGKSNFGASNCKSSEREWLEPAWQL